MLNELLSTLRNHRRDRESDLLTIARKLAAGETVKPERVEGVLSVAGKTVEDLEMLVRVLAERRELAAIVARADELAGEIEELDKTINAAHAAFEAAERKRDAVVEPALAKLELIGRVQQEAAAARSRLIATCPDEALVSQMEQVSERLAQARTDAYELRKKADLVRVAEVDLEQQKLSNGWKASRWADLAKIHKAAGNAAVTDLAEVDAAIPKLEAEHKRLQQLVLRP